MMSAVCTARSRGELMTFLTSRPSRLISPAALSACFTPSSSRGGSILLLKLLFSLRRVEPWRWRIAINFFSDIHGSSLLSSQLSRFPTTALRGCWWCFVVRCEGCGYCFLLHGHIQSVLIMLGEVCGSGVDLHLRQCLDCNARRHLAHVHAQTFRGWFIWGSIRGGNLFRHRHVLCPVQVCVLVGRALLRRAVLELLTFAAVHPVQTLTGLYSVQFALVLCYRNGTDLLW